MNEKLYKYWDFQNENMYAMHIQNVPRQNVPETKRPPKGQNVQRDKRPKGQNVPRGQMRSIIKHVWPINLSNIARLKEWPSLTCPE